MDFSFMFIKDETPPPGSYTVNCFDLSAKVEKSGMTKKRPPFNVASTRFQEKTENHSKQYC